MALILGKPIVGRLETLQYANKKFNWRDDIIIGIGHKHAFYAWLRARLTGKKCIYYCIDFYSPEIADNLWDSIFIWAAMQLDKFLFKHCDEIWDISEKIDEGRRKFGNYTQRAINYPHKIVPLSYPPSYFRMSGIYYPTKIIYVGLQPYGFELLKGLDYIWLGNGRLPLEVLLCELSMGGIGISMWGRKGNNYYGDPGKTKLYSACGIPVIMTDNTPYADIIKKTQAGIVIPYNRESLKWAIKKILGNYSYYKKNVKKTWEYIDADEIMRNINV